MKLLTTAAMALALTGAAAAAHAQQPQQDQQQKGQHQSGQKGGGQQGGQPHYHAPPAGQHNGAGPQGGQHVNGQVQPLNGQHGGPGAGGQAVQRWNGQHSGAGAGGQANGQVQRWNGQRGGPGFNGQQAGRAGFGFQSHGMRDRDQGRPFFNARVFAPRFQAERRFRFGGYRFYPRGWYVRTWNFGDFLPLGWYAPDYYLNWAGYGLPAPPVGCEWIANGPDALLVDIWTGQVVSVYQGAFYWNG